MGPRALGCVKAKGLPGKRLCLEKPCFFPACLLPWWLQRDQRRRRQDGEAGEEQEGTQCPSLLPHLPPAPRPAEDRARCVCAGRRLTRAAGVTWAGHVQPAPFLPQQLAHKQPGCCWRWRWRHVQARGWGTWPCPSQGKALAQHRPAPPAPRWGCLATGNSWCSLAAAKHVFGK